MGPTNPDLQELARRLIEDEARQADSAKGLACVAEHMFQRLHDRLAQLFGSDGVSTLLSRALKLAKRTLPALEPVHVTPDGEVVGLPEAILGLTRAAAIEVPSTLLGCLLDLLAAFIGDDLALRLVDDALRRDAGGESPSGAGPGASTGEGGAEDR